MTGAASDDRVRGGKSEVGAISTRQTYHTPSSHLTCSESTVTFHGQLDIKTLGGAGFASQRTTREDRMWDLADYEGIELLITAADAKQYTFIFKDETSTSEPSHGTRPIDHLL
jgi:hypothetical protein